MPGRRNALTKLINEAISRVPNNRRSAASSRPSYIASNITPQRGDPYRIITRIRGRRG